MSLLQVTRWLVEAINFSALAMLAAIIVGYLSLPALYLFGRRDQGERDAQGPRIADEAAPEVLVQLPVFNEPHVVEGLLDSVAALDWPVDKLSIQLLDDSDDETTDVAARKIEALSARGVHIDHVRRPTRTGFKAAALANGLTRSQAPFVAILDADFRPPTNWLKILAPRLMADPEAAFIQSRCEFSNAGENWLTRVQGLFLDSHFVIEQGVRARNGLLIQFNGTGAVWRRSAIEAAGGWSSETLSEDLDLAIRAALKGHRGLFSAEPAVPGLVPSRIRDWRVQQQRWSRGFAQSARGLAGPIWRSGWTLPQRLSAEFLLFYQVVFPVIAVALAASALGLALHFADWVIIAPAWIVILAMALTLALSMTWPPYRDLGRGGPGRYFATLASVPLVLLLLAFSNAEAIVTGFLGRRDVFHRTPKPAGRALEGD